ncbi:sensor histidine kinase [Solibacillus sp. FSL K6-1523]|uniref:sensor histidine kinase n=1 Tax=Solibacillus sp. FSL K6-1523 TaxID=2921471 RepID=UPI0030F87CDA
MKLNTKVNILSTLLTIVILIGSFTGIYFLFEELAYSTEEKQLRERAYELSTTVSSLQSTENINTIFRAYLPTNGAIIVKTEKGEYILNIQSKGKKVHISPSKDEYFARKVIDGIPHIAMNFPLIWPNQQIVVANLIQPVPTITENLNRLQVILLLITLIALIPIYFASQLLIRLIVKPVQQLTAAMERNIQQSSYEQIAVKKKSQDEIAMMTITYNDLMAQLETHHEQQQQFIGNASHELKTPLTVIESYAKLLKRRGTDNPDVTNEALVAIINETAMMKQMIEQMLALAKTSEVAKVKLSFFAFQPFINTIAQSFQQAFHRTIIVDVPDAIIGTDEAKLKQLLFIFLDNARKYSDEKITIIGRVNEMIEIQIQDRGKGIPKEDIPHLFDRFYRVSKDRNRQTGGVGIGLSIAQEISKQLKATIEVESVLGQGTTIHIQLPLNGGGSNES